MTDPPDAPDASDPEQLTQASPATAPPKQTIGPYRLLQLVGEGGMGEVWLAEQTRPVHRQVALKVIKAGMDTAQVVARFEAERQALALMDHPAIARVFDAGATPQGRPYFVMEYVRGESITSYVTRQKLSMPDRIHLFVQICEGVQHAHQKGIIHRDLKPSNVLVTLQNDRPVPKIIDFGVAKAITHSLTEHTLHTELGALVGTPEYMSPEQAELSGFDVDTRTDVYALGVMLYELMTGMLPFEAKFLREKRLDEIRRTIREVDPPKPSTKVTMSADAAGRSAESGEAGRLASQLRGDLDWITMKALEKDRTRRYATVGELAADLQRHLDNQPVMASPPGSAYRVRKFMRRNRLAVTAAATLVVLLVAFAVTMTVQARRIAHERDRASREATAAKQVSDFLVGLFKTSQPSEARGRSLTAREILDKGAADVDAKAELQPEIRARLKSTMGAVYTSLGLYATARRALEQSAATQASVLGEAHPETLESVNRLADLDWFEGRLDDAEKLYAAVAHGRAHTLGPTHRETLHANYDLASTFIAQNRLEEGERLCVETLEAQKRVLGESDPDTLNSMSNLASVYHRQKRYNESLPLAVRVADLQRRRLGGEHPDTLTSMQNVGTEFEAAGRPQEAERTYLETIAAKRKTFGRSHPITLRTVDSLAHLYAHQKRFDEAEAQFLEEFNAVSQEAAFTLTTTAQNGVAPQNMVKGLIALYEAWGKPDKAAVWRAKLPKDEVPKP